MSSLVGIVLYVTCMAVNHEVDVIFGSSANKGEVMGGSNLSSCYGFGLLCSNKDVVV